MVGAFINGVITCNTPTHTGVPMVDTAHRMAPKAKRIEVWLQPQTVELLDTLTKQWGVGRGKVIDQLLTRGPVPPQSWTEVTESPPPTPSAPPEPEPTPEPTTSGRGTVFDTPEFKAFEEKLARHWDIAKADAKAVPGATPQRVQTFKARHKISPDTPLSPDAQQLLRDELEADQRTANGHQIAVERRLATIKLQLHKNPGLAQAIYEHCSTVDVDGKVATEYLLRLLPDIGVKAYRKLCPGLWKALPTLDIGLLDAQLDSDGIPQRRRCSGACFSGLISCRSAHCRPLVVRSSNGAGLRPTPSTPAGSAMTGSAWGISWPAACPLRRLAACSICLRASS